MESLLGKKGLKKMFAKYRINNSCCRICFSFLHKYAFTVIALGAAQNVLNCGLKDTVARPCGYNYGYCWRL